MNTFPWEYLGTMQSLLASPSHNYPSNLPRSDFNPLVVPGPEAREGTFFLQGLYPTGQLLLPVSLCSIGMERGRQEAEGHPSPEPRAPVRHLESLLPGVSSCPCANCVNRPKGIRQMQNATRAQWLPPWSGTPLKRRQKGEASLLSVP